MLTLRKTEPKWMLEQEIQRRIKELEADERDIQEKLEAIRKEKARKQEEARSKAKYARKRQVRMALEPLNAFVLTLL